MEAKIDGLGLLAGQRQSSHKKVSGTDEFKQLFSQLVAERKGSLETTLEAMEERREEIKQLKVQREFSETVKRILPDGSIRISVYENGHLESCYHLRPKLRPVIDESKPIPKAADGTELISQAPVKLVPRRNILEEMF
ncbi:hypothetical protein SAMN02910356_02268 [Selenomonas sp. GACV-9]|uniref:hypothetical protein n=1 Tax=Selenomonas sp. GACV-9 TaxID=3158782 RepID=UPI0008F19317|nr:hypothetical protein SAMN02910356_02268 [Selenomonas ruminantium]